MLKIKTQMIALVLIVPSSFAFAQIIKPLVQLSDTANYQQAQQRQLEQQREQERLRVQRELELLKQKQLEQQQILQRLQNK
jgi:Tfp pilus assembly protein PilV